jgi:hypothetical protein
MSEQNEEIKNKEEKISYFKTILKTEENSPLLLELESKDNKLIIKITDTNSIGNGLYKCELTKEELDKNNKCFKMFETIDDIIKKLKLICTKNYTINFSENFNTLKFVFEASVLDEQTKFEFNLSRIIMTDKEIINQLCEKVKELNSKVKNNFSNEDNILKKLNSKIFEKIDEYNMINDLILEKNKSKKSIWTKMTNTEARHSFCFVQEEATVK